MLFTRKGDKGDTGLFGCNQRVSKSSLIAEALGTLDETNSFLGLCKVRSEVLGMKTGEREFAAILHSIQNALFTVQAEVAGAEKTIPESYVKELEEIIGGIEQELPPIKSFFVSGGTELAASFDFARTLARRAERRVVGVKEEGSVKVGEHSLQFLNRLSSTLYAMARLTNHTSGIPEIPPDYK